VSRSQFTNSRDDFGEVVLDRRDHGPVAGNRRPTRSAICDVVGSYLYLHYVGLPHVGDHLRVRAQLGEHMLSRETGDCIVGRSHIAGRGHRQGRSTQLWVWSASTVRAVRHRVTQSHDRPCPTRHRASGCGAGGAATHEYRASECNECMKHQPTYGAHGLDARCMSAARRSHELPTPERSTAGRLDILPSVRMR
jgi:hypothetical protein